MRNPAATTTDSSLETTTTVRVSATVAALLLSAVALLQIALALGAPWGAHVYGGRAPLIEGVLSGGYRLMSGAAAAILAGAAWTLLARAGVVGSGGLPRTVVLRGPWAIAALLALNTLSNLASTSPLERWGLGGLTAVTAVLAWHAARSPVPARYAASPLATPDAGEGAR